MGRFNPGDRVELIKVDISFIMYVLEKFGQPIIPGDTGIVIPACTCTVKMVKVAWDVGTQCTPKPWLRKIDDDGTTNAPGSLNGTEYHPKEFVT